MEVVEFLIYRFCTEHPCTLAVIKICHYKRVIWQTSLPGFQVPYNPCKSFNRSLLTGNFDMLVKCKFRFNGDTEEFSRVRHFYDISIIFNTQLVVFFQFKINQLEFVRVCKHLIQFIPTDCLVSFIFILNSRGPSTDPCRIPFDDEFQVLKLVPILLLYFLPVR